MKPTAIMLIKRSAMLEVLGELAEVMADNNIFISIQNDEDFDLMISEKEKES